MSLRTTVYVGTSVDGFIARLDGSVDFLEAGGPVDDDMGYGALMASIDVLVMGRNTFDFVVNAGVDWPYGDTTVMVVTSRPLELGGAPAETVESTALGPAELAAELEARGHRHAYVDGGLTVQAWLRAGLVDELVVTRVPVLVGDGIPLFGPLDHDVALEHVDTTVFGAGYVQSRWRPHPRTGVPTTP